MNWRVLVGDVREKLAELPDGCVQTCVTSPPYWALRDYGVDGQIGMEATPDEFVAQLVAVFREVKRVLRDDGTLWMNLGDSYLAQQGSGFNGQKRLDHANRNVKVQRPAGFRGWWRLRCGRTAGICGPTSSGPSRTRCRRA
jgi:DNA modification methylase